MNTTNELLRDIKVLIIEILELEDIGLDDIEDDAPLFGEGLGLDSIDALELGVALQKKYGLKIKAEDEETRRHFRSARALAELVQASI
jgi:acyl carrier protein